MNKYLGNKGNKEQKEKMKEKEVKEHWDEGKVEEGKKK